MKTGDVLTSTTKACPTGITRATVAQTCQANGIPREFRDLSIEEIHTTNKVFCTSTMGEIVAVSRIDNTVYHDGQPGPVTQRLATLYRDQTVAEVFPIG